MLAAKRSSHSRHLFSFQHAPAPRFTQPTVWTDQCILALRLSVSPLNAASAGLSNRERAPGCASPLYLAPPRPICSESRPVLRTRPPPYTRHARSPSSSLCVSATRRSCCWRHGGAPAAGAMAALLLLAPWRRSCCWRTILLTAGRSRRRREGGTTRAACLGAPP